MQINRRRFFLSSAATAATCVLAVLVSKRTLNRPRNKAGGTVPAVDFGYKIGPAPSVPKPPPTPYPYAALYLFADGHISIADGMCVAQWLDLLARQGFARRIPYGLRIETDKEKLWLLGRSRFAPKISRQVVALHAGHSFG
ncbi:MAG: hypothetical protein AB7G15_13455 [Alphaproteobacteria bacterium]